MQNKDISQLRYWQKRYLQESFWVSGLSVGVIMAAGAIGVSWEMRLWLAVIVVIIAYLMIKALREDLQTRAENLIFEKKAAMFGDVIFDVGGGVTTEVLLAQEVVAGRQARECHNVMKSSMYMWEEDVFYTEQRLKWFSIRNTAFKGVILAVKAPKAPAHAMAKMTLSAQKVMIEGTLQGYLERCNATDILKQILKLLHASSLQTVVSDGKIYFWIADGNKLFYQFSLLTQISPLPFISRVQQLKQNAENLVEAFKN